MDFTLAIEIGIGLFLLATLAVAVEIGFRIGRHAEAAPETAARTQVGTIQAAMLGMLALLLGFSFAGAAGRHVERQKLVGQEANAIGTAYLRAQLLGEPQRSGLQRVLADYLAARVAWSTSDRRDVSPELLAQFSDLHGEMWRTARDGVQDKPATLTAVLTSINTVIDLHSTRLSAGHAHLPGLVLILLVVCSVLAMTSIGYGCGMAGHRWWPMTGALALLISASVWATMDMDHPRIGLIMLNDGPLEMLDLRAVE